MRTLRYLWAAYIYPPTIGRIVCLFKGHRDHIVCGARLCTRCCRVKEL